MKIAIAGKGGVGKTFLAASLANHFSRKGVRVLAVDADPTPSLAYMLGIPETERARIVPISERADLVKTKTDSGILGVYRLNFTVDDIIQNYSMRAPNNVNLIVMGTVSSAGEGCTCPENALLRALMRHLIVQRDEMIILDMEAGLEHMGRGTAEHVDLMIVVAEPGHRSLEVACRLVELARQVKIPRITLIGNKIRNETDAAALAESANKCGARLGALIPYDTAIQELEVKGLSPIERANDSKAVCAVISFGDSILGNSS